MNAEIDELDVVKVVTLPMTHRKVSGSEGVCRAPRVGDLATVVHVLEPGRAFVVEAVNADGNTLWVADFQVEELMLESKHRESG